MADQTHIVGLALENVKRVVAFSVVPNPNGLTIIGGNNGQGKTSVLDGLAWLFGGAKYEPSSAARDGAMNPPSLKATLSNGLVVERKGKNGALSVTDPTGKRHGQALLDDLIGQFAIDLPKFLNASDKEKAQMLLTLLGIGPKLAELEQQEAALTAQRRAFHPIKEAKVKHAQELPEFPDAPDAPVSASDLIKQQQEILLRNAENQKLRGQVGEIERALVAAKQRGDALEAEITRMQADLLRVRADETALTNDLLTAQKTADALQDESDAEIRASLENIEAINQRVAANQAKARALDEAAQHTAQYQSLNEQVEAVRAERMALLEGAALPLPGLTVENGVLLYNGKAWDCMSGSEQLRVGVAIVRGLNPKCGFVLLDKLEQFDLATIEQFNQWLHAEGLQAIATRVSTGDECTIIIEDGLPAGKTYIETVNPMPANAWAGKETF